MNRLSNDDRTRVIACLVEGSSIRATVRMTGIAKKTVSRLGVELGRACERFADRVMVNLPCEQIQCDVHYNFARIHSSLRITPAMAAGLTDHVWELSELVGLLEAEEAAHCE